MTMIVSSDFDEIADAINGIAGRFVPTARSKENWSVQVVGVSSLAVQRLQVGGAASFAGDGQRGAMTIGIPITRPSLIRVDGQKLGEDSFIVVKEGEPFTVAARDVMRWTGVTLPLEANEFFEPIKLIEPLGDSGTLTRSRLRHLSELKSLISRLCIDHKRSEAIQGAALRAAEGELLVTACAILEVSSRATRASVGRPRASRQHIISRTLELLAASDGQALAIQDLCSATRVSERTLRSVFREHFGVGPMRMLKARQLCAVRTALIYAESGEAHVKDVAQRFGVWDLSGFAQQYQQLFAESPSQTLRRLPPLKNRLSDPSEHWLDLVRRWSARQSTLA